METTQEKDLELKERDNFYGTEQYWRGWLGANLTDGAHYVDQNGYGWFISDAVSVIKTTPRLRGEEFIVVKLLLHDPPLKKYNAQEDINEDVVATLALEDGNDNLLYTQTYTFTDAKCKDLKLYFIDNVMMLPSEY